MVRFIIFMLLPAVIMAQLRSGNTNSGLIAEQDTRVLKKTVAKAKPAKVVNVKPAKPTKAAKPTVTRPATTPTGSTGIIRDDASGAAVNINLNGGVRTCPDAKFGKTYWQGTNTGCMTNADCAGITVKDGTACCLWPHCICGASSAGATTVACSSV